MSKKKKCLIIVISIIALLLILFVPIPLKQTFDEGTATTLNSLTYKAIFWNMYEKSAKPYDETEILFFSKNFKSVNDIWKAKCGELQDKGYGAVNISVEIEELNSDYILVTEILSKDGGCFIIDKDTFNEKCNDISFEQLTVDTKLKITCDGVMLDTSPAMFGKIFKISMLKSTVINGKGTNSETNSNDNTDETTIAPSSQIAASNESGTNTVPKTSSSQDTSVFNSDYTYESSTDDFSYNYDDIKDFWSQKIHTYNDHYDSISNINIPYLVVEPADYNPAKKYPVILFLHGAGYRYDYIGSSKVNKLNVETLELSFYYNYKWMQQAIIIAPHISTNDWWNFGQNNDGSLDAAMRIFNKVTDEYSCDNTRYYVTGGSMGGYGTWAVASKYSDIFAAAMPMCGWWSIEDAVNLKNIPVRIIHGTADTTVPAESSKSMYNAIVSAGGTNAILSLYDGAYHDVWKYAYFDSETFDWLFAQVKS